jgi:predicted AAA+ superfamily ATPase
MIFRTLANRLSRLAGPFPVIFLTGPRQSGKTTLARATFPGFRYFSLEDLQTRGEVSEDPRGFLHRLEGAEGIIIDEAQYAPDLFSYLQGFVDDNRSGPVILTGSQHFLMAEKIQSEPGRTSGDPGTPSLSVSRAHRAARPHAE